MEIKFFGGIYHTFFKDLDRVLLKIEYLGNFMMYLRINNFRSCIFGNTKMRHCFLQVQALVGRLTDMGVTEILQRKTYDLDDFFTRQLSLTSDFAKNLGEFRTIVCQLVLDTCKVIIISFLTASKAESS